MTHAHRALTCTGTEGRQVTNPTAFSDILEAIHQAQVREVPREVCCNNAEAAATAAVAAIRAMPLSRVAELIRGQLLSPTDVEPGAIRPLVAIWVENR